MPKQPDSDVSIVDRLDDLAIVRDRKWAVTWGVLSVLLVAYVDYLTDERLALAFFYLLPVIATTRIAGRGAGLLLAFLSAAAFPVTDILADVRLDAWMAFWNFSVRAATLVTVAVLVDRLKQALVHEQGLSRRDPLTQVANSRWFRDQAERELLRARRSTKPVTLAFMDLDNFKTVNDDLGHTKGDELLSRVGSLLDSSTRPFDIVGRLGGDEFALMLPETDAAEAIAVIERIRAGLRDLLREKRLPESVSFSIGIVTTDVPPDSLDALILVADQLMYSAKRAGSNQIRSKHLHAKAPATH